MNESTKTPPRLRRAGLLITLAAMTGACAVTCAAGCAAPRSTFEILDHRAGRPQPYRETFTEGTYRWDESGNVDVVLHRREPAPDDPRRFVTQTIHLKTFWRPLPGRTVAEPTQLNARVTYAIQVGHVGATFEGAGTIFFNKGYWTDDLTGTLEYAALKPTRRLADGADLFQQANLSGSFHARNDPRRTIRRANEITELFGPLPPYQPRETP